MTFNTTCGRRSRSRGAGGGSGIARRASEWRSRPEPRRHPHGGAFHRLPSASCAASAPGRVAAPPAEPILAIRIVDDMGSLLRAPEVVFTAAEVGLERSGCNSPTLILTQALRRQAAESDAITVLERPLADRSTSDQPRPSCVSGWHAPEHAPVRRRRRPQVPLPVRRRHQRASGPTSRARSPARSRISGRTRASRRSSSPRRSADRRSFARQHLEPRMGRPSAIARASLRSTTLLSRGALEARLQGLLGPIGEIGPRGVFPLSGLVAGGRRAQPRCPRWRGRTRRSADWRTRPQPRPARCGSDRRLRGETHVQLGGDVGAPQTLEAYVRAREARYRDARLVDRPAQPQPHLRLLPVQLLRGLGLHALKTIGPLRRLAIREGLAPSYVARKLMRGGAEALGEAP